MANKRKDTEGVNIIRATEKNPIILLTRQILKVQLSISGLSYKLDWIPKSKKEKPYYGHKDIASSTLQWKIQFNNAGTAKLHVQDSNGVYTPRTFFFQIKGRKSEKIPEVAMQYDGQTLRIADHVYFQTSVPKETLDLPTEIYSQTAEVGANEGQSEANTTDYLPELLGSHASLQSFEDAGNLSLVPSNFSLLPRKQEPPTLFRRDAEALAHALRLSPIFSDFGGSKESLSDWFHFSMQRGCRKIAQFAIEQKPILLFTERDGDLPLHSVLRSDKSDKLATFIIHKMVGGPGNLLTQTDNAGISPYVLAECSYKFSLAYMLEGLGAHSTEFDLKKAVDNLAIAKLKWDKLRLLRILNVAIAATFPNRLCQACELGDIDSIHDLIEKGADINSPKTTEVGDGNYPLHCAAIFCHIAVAKLLLSKGARVDTRNKFGDLPIHRAGACTEIISLLAEMGSDIHATNNCGYQPIHSAAFNGNTRGVAKLLELGAELDAKSYRGEEPIHMAAWSGSVETVYFLLAHGASVHAQDIYGATPLHFAARAAKNRQHRKSYPAETVDILVQFGADVNAPTLRCTRPLHSAAAAELGLPVLMKLLHYGAELDAINSAGAHAIHLAAASPVPQCSKKVSYLLDLGVPVDIEDNMGRQPIHYTYACKDPGVAALVAPILMSAGAELSAVDFAALN